MSSTETVKKTTKRIWHKWSIAFKVAPLVAIMAVLKFLAHKYGFDLMELNALFTSLVAGTIFLIGFLISGVLSDYKESEKLPSELSASMKSLFDDTYTVYKSKDSQVAHDFLAYQKAFVGSLKDWLYKREKTKVMLKRISDMNHFFIEMEKEGIQANYIIKMKNEQNSIRKMLLRIDAIRDTDFVGSAYAIVEAMAVLLAFGLIIMKIEPFYVSLFLALLVTFLVSYMFLLIRDLDNPFDYRTNGEGGSEVSLKPINDLEVELGEFVV